MTTTKKTTMSDSTIVARLFRFIRDRLFSDEPMDVYIPAVRDYADYTAAPVQSPPHLTRQERKEKLARKWAVNIMESLPDGLGYHIGRADVEAGPRIARICFQPGEYMSRVRSFVSSVDANHLVPWNITSTPHADIQGKFLVVDAEWSQEWSDARHVLVLGDVEGLGYGEFRIGVDLAGNPVGGTLDDVPHLLVMGQTGSGKSNVMRALAFQFGVNGCRLILVDGKSGSCFGRFNGFAGLLGPVAYDEADVRLALSWALNEMQNRLDGLGRGENANMWDRIVLLVDEFLDYSQDVKNMIDRICRQGRDAHISAVLSAHHATIRSLGNDMRRNLVGRVGLRVEDESASGLVMGGLPYRADSLLGKGDAYFVSPAILGGATRIQCYLIEDSTIAHECGVPPDFESWASATGIPIASGSLFDTAKASYEGRYRELARQVAREGRGSPTLRNRIRDAGLPGIRNQRLVDMMRRAKSEIETP